MSKWGSPMRKTSFLNWSLHFQSANHLCIHCSCTFTSIIYVSDPVSFFLMHFRVLIHFCVLSRRVKKWVLNLELSQMEELPRLFSISQFYVLLDRFLCAGLLSESLSHWIVELLSCWVHRCVIELLSALLSHWIIESLSFWVNHWVWNLELCLLDSFHHSSSQIYFCAYIYIRCVWHQMWFAQMCTFRHALPIHMLGVYCADMY